MGKHSPLSSSCTHVCRATSKGIYLISFSTYVPTYIDYAKLFIQGMQCCGTGSGTVGTVTFCLVELELVKKSEPEPELDIKLCI